MELYEGMTIRDWEVVRLLGAGGMSEVYLVRDNLDRLYALKILSARLTGDNTFRQRFKAEAKIMASLNHSNIIGLHSYFEEQGSYCLVMEYLEGGSLKDLIRRTGPLPEARALPIFRQIAEALAYAHSQGIIHRDVKPSNILISADGQYKLGDFGIARMQESEGLTRTGSRMGTLIYMSPEQINDSKHVDAKTDVYSLGVTLYEMLTGRAPYDESSDSDFSIMEKIVRQDLPDPRTIYPHISETTLDLLKLATRRSPSQRPSFDELLSGAVSVPAPEPDSESKIVPDHDQPPSNEPEPEAPINSRPDLPPSPQPVVWTPQGSSKKTKAAIVRLVIGLIIILILAIFAIIDDCRPDPEPQADTIFSSYTAIKTNELIFVEGGNFYMGSNDGYKNEQPIHQVSISSFYIGKYVVTQAELVQYMQPRYSWESDHGLGDNYPAHYVSWYDAIKYCNLRSLAEGLNPCYTISGSTNPADWGAAPRYNNDGNWDAVTCNFSAEGYRLPTEAEWEFASRGGNRGKGYTYSGSNDLDSVAWYHDNSSRKTHEVGTKAANELGIYDMSGNVWEWCWDWFSESFYDNSPYENPTGLGTGSCRLLRGGCWRDGANLCRVSYRNGDFPHSSHNIIGFRVCRSAK